MYSFHHKTDIFFDLDHTLWDFEKNSALAFETIFKKHDINICLDDFLQYYVPINLEYWKLFREEKITQEELRFQRLAKVFKLIKFNTSDEVILLLSKEYIVYLPTFNHLYDGAIELLAYLKPKYKLHIITNGFQEVQAGKLKNSNIEHYFETITNSDMAGVKKPNPKIFEFALDLAKTNKSNSLMIGDSYEADIEGAINMGLEAIFFNEYNAEVMNGLPHVNHLLALKNYL